MKFLTLFSIGPVQSFIAKARKLQDLYAGSYLLSYLTKQTLIYAQNEPGAEIIFPNPNQESAPNRFLMTVETENEETLRRFCVSLDEYVRNQWVSIAKEVTDKAKLQYTNAAHKQIDSMLQVFYASEPYKTGDDFGICYENVIRRLGIAKNLRSFVQLDEGCGRKCDLMYEYNALFCHHEYDEEARKRRYITSQAQPVNTDNVPRGDLQKYLQKEESLSAPAFVKRCLKHAVAAFDDDFPSIDDIYRMHDKTLSTEDDKRGYYALLMFDGDDMGKWYSTPDIRDKSRIEEFQKYLSGKISEFAAEKSHTVVNYKQTKSGVVIYAGGEDFLGALNLKDAFSVLRELRDMFGQIDLRDYTDKTLTFSAGMVLAHIKAPLSEVLTMARQAEHKAKANPGKDSFCLTIAKHSGEVTDFVMPFSAGAHNSIDALDKLVKYIVDDELSTKFIYRAAMEMERIIESGKKELIKEVFLVEVKRLLMHSDYEGKSDKQLIINDVYGILKNMSEITDVKNVLRFLRAVAFIARERGAGK